MPHLIGDVAEEVLKDFLLSHLIGDVAEEVLKDFLLPHLIKNLAGEVLNDFLLPHLIRNVAVGEPEKFFDLPEEERPSGFFDMGVEDARGRGNEESNRSLHRGLPEDTVRRPGCKIIRKMTGDGDPASFFRQ